MADPLPWSKSSQRIPRKSPLVEPFPKGYTPPRFKGVPEVINPGGANERITGKLTRRTYRRRPKPIPETALTKMGSGLKPPTPELPVTPQEPRKKPSKIKPKALPESKIMAKEAVDASKGQGKYDFLKPDPKAAKVPNPYKDPLQRGIDKTEEFIDKKPILKAAKNLLKKGAFLAIPYDPKTYPKTIWESEEAFLARSRPCPLPSNKCRDGSRCGGRSAYSRGPTRGYDKWWGEGKGL